MSADAETGELNQDWIYDHETGELFDYRLLVSPPPIAIRQPAPGFHVPRSYLEGGFKKDREISIKRNITLGYNPTHKLFLIPSLFLFFRITALVLLTCELILHLWAHRKNNHNPDSTVFYRSPLHLISSQFCAYCTSEVRMIKLGRIQDKRREAKRLIAFSG